MPPNTPTCFVTPLMYAEIMSVRLDRPRARLVMPRGPKRPQQPRKHWNKEKRK